MHERLATLRWVGILFCAAMMCFAPVFATGTEVTNPADGSALVASGSAVDTNLFSRTVVWWPYTTGPSYGEVRRSESRDMNVLHLSVGSFRLGEALAIPAELTNGLSFQGGSQQYFLAQLRPSALSGPFAQTLASQGAEIVARVPVNGLVLRMDQAAYQLVSSSPVLQYLEPYHAAYKLSPHIGHATQSTPEAAASANFNLLLNLFAGEPVGPTVEAIRAIGGSVSNAVEGHSTVPGQVWATVHASKIADLARLESVFSITEESPTQLFSDGALYLQSQSALFGDFPYWKAGIDGDDVLIHVTDSGMSVDAYDFANTSSVSGWNTSTCHVVADQRKVTCYQTAASVGGGGDLSSCDAADSAGPTGSSTHGQMVSGVALGNGTRGTVPATDKPSPVDMGASDYWGGQTPPVFGDGYYDDIDNNGVFSELVDTGYDGIAKGARLVFYDATAGCPESDTINAGSSVSNLTVPWTDHHCFIHNASYGSVPDEGNDPDYAFASASDAEIFSNPVHVSVRAAGNAGARSTSGTSADPGNIDHSGSCHNCIVVGASGGVGGGVYGFSSEGPAGTTRERVAPLLMAEGYDYACRSEEGVGNGENQTGAATCQNQAAQGTSFSSPNIAGAAALIVEYFQKGMYPSGSYRAEDETGMISSALVKALMIAGTKAMAPEARGIADGRFNNVWGYGQLFLVRTLPLADFPEETVSGLIVHDLPGDLDGDGTEDGASHLTLPATMPTTVNDVESAEFEVLADDEDLGVVLVWHDDSSVDAINNDLDLELLYCGTGTCSDGDASERLYRGNAFSEFPTRDPANNHDLDGDNAPTGWSYSISEDFVTAAGENYDTWRDSWNNTEAIFIPSELNRPNPKDDFPAVTVGTWQISVIRRTGNTQVPISVVINGPVAADSTVRLDQNPVVCNGAERIVVSEVDRGEDSGCTEASCPDSTITSRTTVRVYDASDVLVDTEADIPFTRVENTLKFESTSRLPLTRHMATPVDGDGILSVDHEYRIEATYADVSGATPVNRVSNAKVDCSPDLDILEQGQIGKDFPFQLIGGCDHDNYLDENETFSFSVSFYNADPSDLLQAEIRMRACENASGNRNPKTDGCTPVSYIKVHDNVQALGLLPSQTRQFTRFAFTVTGAPAGGREMVDLDVCLAGDVTGQYIEDCVTFTMLADADDEKHYYITDCPDGCEARHDINNDEEYEESIARNDFDPLDFIRRGQSEFVTYESLRTAGDENSNGTSDCEEQGQSFTCGNPGFTGPWDFDSDDDGFRTGIDTRSESSTSITNWGEDHNFNNELDTDLGEDENGDFFLTQNWSKNGGCGYMSNDSGSGARGGVWHTGTIGNYNATTSECRTSESICELYDVFTTTEGTALWFEMLHTPIIHPVHFGTHPDGFDWRTQVVDWSWAMQWDEAPGSAFTWELDLDTDDDRVIPGDAFISGGIFGGEQGLVNGGQWDIFDGGLAFTDTNPVTGDERIPSKGGNREARRGCYFNDLIAEDDGEFMVDRTVNYPKPWDDDCDNEISLGPDGCPGLCGVDDDGNGVVDDPQELCSCKRCQGGPRDGQACFLTKYCNPETDRDYLCDFEVNSAGKPSGFGDDVCGDGATDEGVFADFGTSILHAAKGERAERNGTPELVNGIGRGGRGAGTFEYNTIEDIYGPPGDSWQGEIGFAVFEGTKLYDQAYGMAVDSMVLEWMEVHPVPQSIEDVCYTTGTVPDSFEGQCAVVSLGETGNTFDGDGLVTISVTDHEPTGNLVDCGNGVMGVEVSVSSEAERVPEIYCLEPVETGSPHYQGQIRTSTSVNAAGDHLVYLAFNGNDTPSITASYIDKDDGLNAVDSGPDGQPGIAGFDDDGDGTVDEADELCPNTNVLGPGRSPHIPGQPARYSDDNCGCRNNPISDSTFATFDSIDAVISNVRISDNGDGDGWADPGEEVTVEFTLRNMADFPLENIRLRLATRSDKVDCLTGDTITISRLEKLGDAGDEVDIANPPSGVEVTGSFTFVAADVTRPASVGTGSDFYSEFSVTLQGMGKATAGADGGGRRDTLENLDVGTVDVPIFGTSVLQTFRVVHNLDATEAGSTTTWADDFESYDTDADMFVNWIRHNTGDDEAELDGTRCQHNDPANPFGNNTDPLNFCEVGEGFDNTKNEWHLAGPNGCLSQGGDPCSHWQRVPRSFDRNVPASGDNGDKAMMMSWHNYINLGFFDHTADNMSTFANRMRWIETANNIQLGGVDPADPAPELTYWTQMSLVDGRLFVGLDFPVAFDAARTFVCVDDNNNNECDTLETGNQDGSEHWEVLTAYFNPEQSFRQPNFINCMFEPSDDGDNEDMFYPGSQDLGPSSTCFPQLSDTCIGRTRADHPQAATTGRTFVTLRRGCFPETGVVDSLEPGIYEEGTGEGIWALRKYDLQQFRGRKILLRFHASPGGIPGLDFLSQAQPYGNRDDGWSIDDIQITGARTSGFSVSVDDTGTTNPTTCPTTTCGSVTARVAVTPLFLPSDSRYKPVPLEDKTALACSDTSVEYCDFDEDGTPDATSDVAQSDAPGRKWLLDARASSATSCFGGDLQYRMELPNGTLLRDWLSDAGPAVAPIETTVYNVFVRCSSDFTCTDTVTITINVGPQSCMTENLTFNSDKVNFSWLAPTGNACPAIYDVAKGDLAALRSSGNFSGASCLENDTAATSSSDSATPATGAGFYYLSSADGESWNTGAASQTGDRDTTLTACP